MSSTITPTIEHAHSCRDAGHHFARKGDRAVSMGATATAIAWWRQARDEYDAAADEYAACGAHSLEGMARRFARSCSRTIEYNGGAA